MRLRFRILPVFVALLCLGCPEQPGPEWNHPDPARSTVAVDRASGVIADGADTAAITITLRDVEGRPMGNFPVAVTVTGEGNQLEVAARTDADGVARGTLTSTRAESKVLTVTAEAVRLAARPQVQFVAGPVHLPSSSLTADPTIPLADGSAVTLSLTLRDAFANPVGQQTVSFSATGTGNTLVPAGEVTDASGRLTAALSSTVAETKTLQASFGAQQLSLELTFRTGPATAPPSTLTASKSTATADGVDSILLTATVLDASGDALAGRVVPFSVGGTGGTLDAPSCTTDAQGQCGVQLTTLLAGEKPVTAQVDAVQLATTVTFVAGPADAAHCSLTSDRVSAAASGTDPIVFSGAAADAQGNPLIGAPVTVATTGPRDSISPASVVTDSSGAFSFTLTTPRAISDDTVTVTLGAVVLTRQVSFGPSRVRFDTQPAFEQRPLVPLAPALSASLRDADDLVVSWATQPITLGLANNLGGLTLGGTATRTPVAGVATFDDLTVSEAGDSLRLTAGAGTLISATSDLFRTDWAWNRAASPAGAEVRALALAADSSFYTVAYLGTSTGRVFRAGFTAAGREPWLSTSDGLPGDPIGALAIDPASAGHAFAGTLGGGVHETNNHGGSWAPILTGLPGGTPRVVQALAVLPGGTVYAGTAGGVFVRGAGGNWTSANTGSIAAGPPISVLVAEADALYAATSGGQGVHRLPLGTPGAVWLNASGADGATLPTKAIRAMTQGAAPDVLFASLSDGAIYRTTDAGGNWSQMFMVPEVPSLALLVPPGLAPSEVYAGTDGDGVQLVSGSNTQQVGSSLAHPVVTTLALEPNSATLVAGTVGGVWVLEGSTWAPWTEGLEGLPFGSMVGAMGRMAVGSPAGGGVYVSEDDGATWSVANTGLADTHVSGLAYDPGPRRFYAGTREGVFQSTDGLTWTPFGATNHPVAALTLEEGVVHVATTLNGLWSSDGTTILDRSGGTNAPHPGTPTALTTTRDFLLVGYGDGNICRQEVTAPLKPWRCDTAPTSAPILTLAGEGQRGTRAYAGTDGAGAFSATDTKTWTQLSPPHFRVHRAVVSPSDAITAYLGTELTVNVSFDAGGNWSDAGNGLPQSSVIDALWINPSDPLHLRASVRGALWETLSGGR